MASSPKYSIIVPVYNRPDEIEELLASLTKQTYSDFEVLIIEDGSKITCEKVYEKYIGELNIRYFFKPNSGPGPSRNYGYEQSKGDFLIVFDSDCIIPPQYLDEVEKYLEQKPLDAWGGPDQGHKDFTPIQQAMAITMSSVLTTGGIRGGGEENKSFQPRSFNMGISRKVFEKTGGFKFDRYAEDIEFSIRMKTQGFRVGYISEAFVYHKRRTSLKQFYYQVYNFGRGRVQVGRVHKGAIKITHWFPSFFLLGLFVMLILFVVNFQLASVFFIGYLIYLLAVVISAIKISKSFWVGVLSGPSAIVQLCGYGAGFIKEIFS